MRTRKFKLLVRKYDYNPSDSAEKKKEKSIAFIAAIVLMLSGILWVSLYFSIFGVSFDLLVGNAVFAVLLVFVSLCISHYKSNFKILVHTIIPIVIISPFIAQTIFRSFHESGFIISWSFLGAIGALVLLPEYIAKKYAYLFFGLFLISLFFSSTDSVNFDQTNSTFIHLSYLFNIGVTSGMIFIILKFDQRVILKDKQFNLIAKELRHFFNTANNPIFGIDSKGLVNEWNQTTEKITGFTKKEVMGKDLVKTYITEDYQEQVKEVLDNALNGEETANYEFPLFTKDNNRVMVLLNSSSRRDATGKIIGVLGVGQDITEMDELRTKSESVAKELRQFIETANAPIFGIDSKGKVNEWNQTAEKITGFTKKEVMGKDLVKTYITEDYQEQVKEVLDNALNGEETANYEFPLFTKDNNRVMVLLNSSTRRDATGKIIGVLGVGQDITDLNEYRENLEAKIIGIVKERTEELEVMLEKEKELGLLKSSFVSMASHQFRTPLAVIQSNAQLFEMLSNSGKEVAPEKYVQISDRIRGEISKMTELMDEVLILGKLASGNVHFDPQELDLVEFCNSMIEQFNMIQKDGRTLDFEMKGKPYNVKLDSKLLTHSLTNIISNAFKYSLGKENPTLKVTYETKAFSLMVLDKGIGIPKEDMQDLMQPFFRGNNSIGIQGTGLGLSIAKEYIDVNKGVLIVKSTEGLGSSFEIKFQR